MARRGKKRKIAARRHPDGSVAREKKFGPTPEMIRQRARVVGIKQWDNSDAAWLIGAWYLCGKLKHPEYHPEKNRLYSPERLRDAGHAFTVACRLYERLLLTPKQPQAVAIGRVAGGETPDDPEAFQRAKYRYDRMYEAVRGEGWAVLRHTMRAVRGEAADPEKVVVGLAAIARLDKRRAAA